MKIFIKSRKQNSFFIFSSIKYVKNIYEQLKDLFFYPPYIPPSQCGHFHLNLFAQS